MAEKKTVIKTGDKSKKSEETLKLKNLLTPRATEKTYNEQAKNTYAFFVPSELSKQDIKTRIETEFKVTVTNVRVLTRKGKKCRFSKGKHAYPGTAFRRNRKLAYATLKDGDSITVFKTADSTNKAAQETIADQESRSDTKSTKVSAKDAKTADKNADKEKK